MNLCYNSIINYKRKNIVLNKKIFLFMIKVASIFLILNFSACAIGIEESGNIGKYEEKVVIPKYNPNDVTHVLITPSNGKWNRYVLNDPNKKHFYVKPGKYTNRVITLTVSGSKTKRRTLSLYNNNNTHPGILVSNQVADIRIALNNASYWVFDRVATLNSIKLDQAMSIKGTSSNNIFNRMLIEKFNNGVMFFGSGNNNVIQNSSFRNMHLYAPDGVAVALTQGKNRQTLYSIKNTKIINNEFYNCNDSIQLVRRNRLSDGAYQDANYEGTIIDGNIMYIDNKIYTDGHGKLNAKGLYALAENALDMKAGSDNPNKPVLVTNNIMWGYRKSDNLSGGKRSDSGAAVVIHLGVKNIKIKSNVIFDSAQGIVVGVKNRFKYALNNAEITSNIFYDTGSYSRTNSVYGSVILWECSNVIFKRNTLIKARVKSIWGKATIANVSVVENVIIDSARPYNETPSKNKFNYNYYYNTFSSGYASGVHDKDIMVDSSQIKMTDFTFKYDNFTAKPQLKKLPKIITTDKSEHYNKAGSNIRQDFFSAASSTISKKKLMIGILTFNIL